MIQRAVHLARRFFVSLRGRAPGETDLRWAVSYLSEAERVLWERMTATDQAHAIEVARRASETVADPTAVAAALLHDVGKVDADAGVLLRVMATLLGPLVGDARARVWASRSGVVGRLGRQLSYPARGAELLAGAGSHRLVVQWAAEHHQRPERWTVDHSIGQVLQSADDAAS